MWQMSSNPVLPRPFQDRNGVLARMRIPRLTRHRALVPFERYGTDVGSAPESQPHVLNAMV
jgi:hypothetical protein